MILISPPLDAVGTVESVKAASEIMTPVSGTISSVNEILPEQPALVNSHAESEGMITVLNKNWFFCCFFIMIY